MALRPLADLLLTFTVDQLEALHAHHLDGWRLPGVYGGHRVDPDATADLVYTLGLLGAAGVDRVAGTDIDDAIGQLLARVDGPGTHTFFSYRIAETLARRGPFAGNPLLTPLSGDQQEVVRQACDSSDWLPLLDQGLPRNYAAVLARVETARRRLGLDVDTEQLEELVDRVRALLTSNPAGYLDDSEDGTGARYDIYSADIYLFCLPLVERLGPVWWDGARHAVGLVSRVVASNGAAVTWGRSTGALAVCLTIELAALALAPPSAAEGGPGQQAPLTDDPGRWLGLAERATSRLDDWFDDGVINAHRHRSPFRYRGPFRRLQMTLDCLGKLAWSAGRLQLAADRADRTDPGAEGPAEAVDRPQDIPGPMPITPPHPDRDEVVWFEPSRSGVWSFRSPHTAFVLPLVGPAVSDYQPAPHNPTLYEQPVDTALATWVPTVVGDGVVYVGAGVPTDIVHAEGELRTTYDHLAEATGPHHQGRRLPARRTVVHRVAGRSLHITEELHLDRAPDAVAVTVPEARGRPLLVTVSSNAPHRVARVDTDGMKEWRSFWGTIPTVHEVDFADPPGELSWTVTVTPAWRVATESGHHHYHRSLYEPVDDRVVQRHFARHHLQEPDGGASRLADVDLYHLHWPEWFVDDDLEAARAFCDLLDRCEVRLVWTQHNLVPHRDPQRFDQIYRIFARRADGVIHHSEWGRERACARWPFRESAVHAVIPHGHFGNLVRTGAGVDAGAADRAAVRRAAEVELGLPTLPSGGLRLGVVGAPRRAKRTVELMEAFARTDRDDLQLLVLSLDEGEMPIDDPRITALPYHFVDRDTYNRRLHAIDLFAFPFDPGGDMLTTGVVGDVVALGRPALISSWAYLHEILGEAGLPLGDTAEEMTAALQALDPAATRRATEAVLELAELYAWPQVAEQTLAFFEAVGTARL